MTSEREIQNSILRDTAREPVRLFRSNAGKWFNVPNPCPVCATRGRWIQGFPAGAPDLIGLVHGGRAVSLETKTASGKQRDEQKDWQAMWERFGGVYLLCRSSQEAIDGIRKAQQ